MMTARISTNARSLALLLGSLLSIATAQTNPTGAGGSEPIFHVGGNVIAPGLLYEPEPEFSEAARRAHHQGVCELRLIVGSDGNPRDIKITRSLGMGLDEKSIEAVRKWRFEPARKDGRPVAVEMTVTFSFSLEDDDARTRDLLERIQREAPPRPAVLTSVQSCPPSSSSHEQRSSDVSITIAELIFEGAVKVSMSDQEEIAASLKRASYAVRAGIGQFDVAERIRAAWQDRGYFKVEVSADARTLTSSPAAERIAVTVHVNEGQQYRLRGITFNKALVSDMQMLRNLFPTKDGSIFKRQELSEGLVALRKAFEEMGYINFTAVPDARVDEENGMIDLVINMDEGKQFFISAIRIVGSDPDLLQSASRYMPLQPGDVYNRRLVELFIKKYASSLNPVPSGDHDLLQLDEVAGTVAITFDLRNCSALADSR